MAQYTALSRPLEQRVCRVIIEQTDGCDTQNVYQPVTILRAASCKANIEQTDRSVCQHTSQSVAALRQARFKAAIEETWVVDLGDFRCRVIRL